MYIPNKWEYKNPSLYQKLDGKRPHAFGVYGELIGAFQISCKEVNEYIRKLIKKRKEPIQSSSSKKLTFSNMLTKNNDVEMHIFTCAVDDHYFLATYTLTDRKPELKSKYERELAEVKEALSTIKFIKLEFRDIVSSNRRFDLFMTSIAATIDLLNKAGKNGSLIEYVALSANKIDALLRLSIILSQQIEEGNALIDTKYLFQADSDKAIMERTIYNTVLEKGIISVAIYEELEKLYRERNKVVHRYIITDIRTEDIKKIAYEYYQLSEKIDTIVNDLEKKQNDLNVGIHKNNETLGTLGDTTLKEVISKIRDKHGDVGMNDILGNKIIK